MPAASVLLEDHFLVGIYLLCRAQVVKVSVVRVAAAAPEQEVVLDALCRSVLTLKHFVVMPRKHAMKRNEFG
eukprot:6190571-Pleurochrysis_carterae.AAC.8